MAGEESKRFIDAIIRTPSIHRSVRNDPLGALERMSKRLGINPGDVDMETLELVASLSDEELEVMSDLRNRVERVPSLAPPGDAIEAPGEAEHDGAIIF